MLPANRQRRRAAASAIPLRDLQVPRSAVHEPVRPHYSCEPDLTGDEFTGAFSRVICFSANIRGISPWFNSGRTIDETLKCADWTELSFRRIQDALVSPFAHDTARISSAFPIFRPLSRFNRRNSPRLRWISIFSPIESGISAAGAIHASRSQTLCLEGFHPPSINGDGVKIDSTAREHS